MTEENKDEKPTSKDNYKYPGDLEESILVLLKLRLQMPLSESMIYEVFSHPESSYAKDLNKDKLRYALVVLELEGLILSDKQDDETFLITISRDGLRLLRNNDKDVAKERRHRKWVESQDKCKCTK